MKLFLNLWTLIYRKGCTACSSTRWHLIARKTDMHSYFEDVYCEICDTKKGKTSGTEQQSEKNAASER